MFIKKFKPITNGTRQKKLITLPKRLKFKPLIKYIKKKNGKNLNGRIILRYRGGGFRKKYRIVDYFNFKYNFKYSYIGLEKSKHTSAPIMLMKSENNFFKYITQPLDFDITTKINTTFAFLNKELSNGQTLPIGWIPNNTLIFNLETHPFSGAKLIRSAGVYGKIVAHNSETVNVKLPSKKIIAVSKYCFATVGRIANLFHKFQNYSKAGLIRNLNRRPRVAGEAMNACDHPMGGRTRKGKPIKNIWGKIIK